ncbi:MAG TPA: response regulator, partial [Gemmatimonadaceae bacterium]
TFLERVREFFERDGYRVATARSGEEALEMLEHVQVDCVLLDMQMAGISGLETCRRLKANPATRDIPVVMLTAHDDQATVIEALDEGADDFIAKSSDFGLLRGRVCAQLRRRHFEAENRQMREELHRREMEAREARASRELAEIRAALLADLERKNRELERAREQAVRESRFKSRFLANMSHELRTPLNAIIGFSEVLGDGLMGTMTERQRGFVGDIFRAGKHLLSLINDILDLSKVEAGKMMLDLASTEVSSLLANSLSIVKGQAATRRVQLDMEIAADLGSIRADARKVKQIAYNILSNAVKFSGEGGQVMLRARRVARAQVGTSCDGWPGRRFPLPAGNDAEFLMLSVTDDGIGIARDAMETLFKPFTQVEGGLARGFEGTGLGLVMVKLLAELHGGTVAVESLPGEGSCFTVWLPYRAAEPDQATGGSAPATLPQPRVPQDAPTALVVENDATSVALIQLQLEAEGFHVVHAATADEALRVATEQPLSLITLNVLLPDGHGWDFLRRLKEVPALHRIPVVIISILADRRRGFALGAAAVLQKPIGRQELLQLLVELGLSPRADEGLRVLVVDDDRAAVELTAARLVDIGATVLRASGGREAIEVANRELPDLIVLDLMMPEVSGFDVVEALNEHPQTTRIPIIVLTARDITTADRTRLNGYVSAIMQKAAFDSGRFAVEVRRAMSAQPEHA